MSRSNKNRLICTIFGLVAIIVSIPFMLALKHKEDDAYARYLTKVQPTCFVEEVEYIASEMLLTDGDYDINFFIDIYNFERPNLGFVRVQNQKVVGYEFYFDTYIESLVNDDFQQVEYDKSKLISIKEFGAVGDGITDDSKAFLKAGKYISENGGILYFPTANYVVSVPNNKANVLEINGAEEPVVIDYMGSTVTLKPNSFPRYVMCYAVNTKNIIVKNGHLVGDRLSHQFVDGKYEYKTHAHGVGVYYRNTTYGLIYNMESSQFTGDSLCIRNGQSGGELIVDQCNLHHSRRQGITVCDADQVLIKNTEIHHIGDFDGVMGTAPRSGIDIEPDSGTFVVNKVIIDNVNIHDVGHYGIVTNKNPEKVYAPDLTVVNSVVEKPCFNYATVRNTTFNFTKDWSILLKDNDIKNTRFNMDTHGSVLFMEGGVTDNCVYQASRNSEYSDGRIFFYDTLVTNCHFIDLIGRGNFATRSNADYGIILFGEQGAFADGSRNNMFNNCTIYARGDIDMDYSILHDCVMYTSDSVSLKGFEMYGGLTLSSEKATIEMTDCKLVNAGTFEKSIKKMKNCYLEFARSNGAFGANSTIENTDIVVTGEATINTFLLIEKFDHDSSITINNYSNMRQIDNKYSNDIRDIVRYLGDKTLTYYLDK